MSSKNRKETGTNKRTAGRSTGERARQGRQRYAVFIAVAVAMMFVVTAFTVAEQNVDVADASEAEGLNYVLDGTVMTITIANGGTMPNYTTSTLSSRPWNGVITTFTEVIMPIGLTSVGSYAFYGATSMVKITLTSSVTAIGVSAFQDSGLVSITIPRNVSSIGDDAFKGCTNLTAIGVNANNPTYMSEDGVLFTKATADRTLLVYPNKHHGTFYLESDGVSSKEYVIPYGTIKIYKEAFRGNQYLEFVVITEAVQQIQQYAFAETKLCAVQFPRSVTNMGVGAFMNCTELMGVGFAEVSTDPSNPYGLSVIPAKCFAGCTKLMSIITARNGGAISYTASGDDASFPVTDWTKWYEHNGYRQGKTAYSALTGAPTLDADSMIFDRITFTYKDGSASKSEGGTAVGDRFDFYIDTQTSFPGISISRGYPGGDRNNYDESMTTKVMLIQDGVTVCGVASSKSLVDQLYLLEYYVIPDSATSQNYLYETPNLVKLVYIPKTCTLTYSVNPWKTTMRGLIISDENPYLEEVDGVIQRTSDHRAVNFFPSTTTIVENGLYNSGDGSAQNQGQYGLIQISPDAERILSRFQWFVETLVRQSVASLEKDSGGTMNLQYLSSWNQSRMKGTIDYLLLDVNGTRSSGYHAFYPYNATESTAATMTLSAGVLYCRENPYGTNLVKTDSVTGAKYALIPLTTAPDAEGERTATGMYTLLVMGSKEMMGTGSDLTALTGATSSARPDWCTYIDNGTVKHIVIQNCFTTIGAYTFASSSYSANNTVGITLPSNVTSVGAYAFQNLHIQRIFLPSGLTSLDLSCFDMCKDLAYIHVSDSNTAFTSVDGILMTLEAETDEGTGTTTYTNTGNAVCIPASIGTEFTMPDEVVTISSGAAKNSKMKSIDLNNTTAVQSYAFYGSVFTDLNTGKVITIGEYAFAGSSDLRSVQLSRALTTISANAFSDTDVEMFSLESITGVYEEITIAPGSIPTPTVGWYENGALKIDDIAFKRGNFYTKGEVTEGFSKLGDNGLYYRQVESGDQNILIIRHSDTTKDGTMPNFDTTSEGRSPFQTSTTSVILPATLRTVGNYAFYNLGNLSSITIPTKVVSIGEGAFQGTALSSVTIPNSVTALGDGAFYGLSTLKSATIGSGIATISESAFASTGLTTMAIPSTVTAIGESAFASTESLTSVDLGTSLKTIGACAFSGSGLTGSISIPQSVTSIGEEAFKRSTSSSTGGITALNIGGKVATIGNRAFSGHGALATVMILGSDTLDIGANAFSTYDSETPVSYTDILYKRNSEGAASVLGTGTARGFAYTAGETGTCIQVGANIKAVYASPTLFITGSGEFYESSSESWAEGALDAWKGYVPTNMYLVGDLTVASDIFDSTNAANIISNLKEMTVTSSATTFSQGLLSPYQITDLRIPAGLDCSIAFVSADSTVMMDTLKNLRLSGSGAANYTAENYTKTPWQLSAGFQKVILEEDVDSIGAYMFKGMDVSYLDLSNITSIGSNAFNGSGFTSLNLKGGYLAATASTSVESVYLGDGAFDGNAIKTVEVTDASGTFTLNAGTDCSFVQSGRYLVIISDTIAYPVWYDDSGRWVTTFMDGGSYAVGSLEDVKENTYTASLTTTM